MQCDTNEVLDIKNADYFSKRNVLQLIASEVVLTDICFIVLFVIGAKHLADK